MTNENNENTTTQERFKHIGIAFLKRLSISAVILSCATLVIFLIVLFAPGSASDVLGFKSETHGSKIVHNLKWFLKWIRGVITKLDFGESLIHKKPVLELLKPRLVKTAILTLSSLLITFIIALIIGFVSATGRYPRFSDTASSLSYLASAAPIYWVAFIAIYLSIIIFGFFPVQGKSAKEFAQGAAQNNPSWIYFIIPIFLLSIFNGTLGEIIRHIRGELEEILKKEYMQAVRARGLGRRKYLWHALRNALAPSIGLITSNLTLLLGGAVVVEKVFSLRGIGYQAWESAGKRDTPVILGITVILVFCVVTVRLLSDVFCHIIDPRFQSEIEE